ncbi:hypothetical protein Q7C36_006024 [Tachysurus vachellii]|uniref:Uncharacterized protein n=1 Tax=Tachysurus vachellii TaxID=175792 RepID=A0AA88NEZ1_TACVA|nr:hypothetical protein Q7C36_006024 [Tachysurus vachellii]
MQRARKTKRHQNTTDSESPNQLLEVNSELQRKWYGEKQMPLTVQRVYNRISDHQDKASKFHKRTNLNKQMYSDQSTLGTSTLTKDGKSVKVIQNKPSSMAEEKTWLDNASPAAMTTHCLTWATSLGLEFAPLTSLPVPLPDLGKKKLFHFKWDLKPRFHRKRGFSVCLIRPCPEEKILDCF